MLCIIYIVPSHCFQTCQIVIEMHNVWQRTFSCYNHVSFVISVLNVPTWSQHFVYSFTCLENYFLCYLFYDILIPTAMFYSFDVRFYNVLISSRPYLKPVLCYSVCVGYYQSSFKQFQSKHEDCLSFESGIPESLLA